MNSYSVKLNSIDKVKNFVRVVSTKDGKYELVLGQYVINAKSILGIFSLDLSKTLELRTEQEQLPNELVPFLVKRA